MDRNAYARRITRKITLSLSARRAWIEIGDPVGLWHVLESLSARRAWIEIAEDWLNAGSLSLSLSARRAWIEIFDRNKGFNTDESLSARRAWIEISTYVILLPRCQGRSPQGERG